MEPPSIQRMFKADIGMTRKRFSRIRRFQRALQLAGNRGEIVWTDIAHACGYYDQAYFIATFTREEGRNDDR